MLSRAQLHCLRLLAQGKHVVETATGCMVNPGCLTVYPTTLEVLKRLRLVAEIDTNEWLELESRQSAAEELHRQRCEEALRLRNYELAFIEVDALRTLARTAGGNHWAITPAGRRALESK